MKKALKVILFAAAVLMVTGCAKKGPAAGKSEPTKINLWSFTDEIPGMVEKFQSTHPELNFELNTTIIATTNQEYEPALIPALQNGDVDIYAAEAAFIYKYTQGDMADYAAPYKDLGIDIDKKN
jgi:ABC-type glycerol-3-phosphate transport system substrate-binding protein